jgi:hypothetical protein
MYTLFFGSLAMIRNHDPKAKLWLPAYSPVSTYICMIVFTIPRARAKVSQTVSLSAIPSHVVGEIGHVNPQVNL